MQRVRFAFILKVEVPCSCLHRADGAHHLEIQSNQHRLREEPFPIKCQFRFLQQKKVAVIGLTPLKKRHSCLTRTFRPNQQNELGLILYIFDSVIISLVQLSGFKHVNANTLERKFYI